MENEKTLDNLLEKLFRAERKSRLFNFAATALTIIGATTLVFMTVISTAKYYSARAEIDKLTSQNGELNKKLNESNKTILNNTKLPNPSKQSNSTTPDNSNNATNKPCDSDNENVNKQMLTPDNTSGKVIDELRGEINRLNIQLRNCKASKNSNKPGAPVVIN